MRNGASQMRATLETLALKTYDHSCWNRLACFASIGAEQARPGLNPSIETLSEKRVCLMFIIQIRSDDNFRVADHPGIVA